MFRPIFEWRIIACAGTFNVFITRYVCLPRVKSPVCHRSGVQLNVANVLCNINIFISLQANRVMTFANWPLSPSPQFINFTEPHVISDEKLQLNFIYRWYINYRLSINLLPLSQRLNAVFRTFKIQLLLNQNNRGNREFDFRFCKEKNVSENTVFIISEMY